MKMLMAAPPGLGAVGVLAAFASVWQDTAGLQTLGPATRVTLGVVVLAFMAALPAAWTLGRRMERFQTDTKRAIYGGEQEKGLIPRADGLEATVYGEKEEPGTGMLSKQEKLSVTLFGDDESTKGIIHRVNHLEGHDEDFDRKVSDLSLRVTESERVLQELRSRLGPGSLGGEGRAG